MIFTRDAPELFDTLADRTLSSNLLPRILSSLYLLRFFSPAVQSPNRCVGCVGGMRSTMRKLGNREDSGYEIGSQEEDERARVEPQFTTRATYNLFINLARLNCSINILLSIRIIKLWNNLPKDIVEACSFQSYKPRSNCTLMFNLRVSSLLFVVFS